MDVIRYCIVLINYSSKVSYRIYSSICDPRLVLVVTIVAIFGIVYIPTSYNFCGILKFHLVVRAVVRYYANFRLATFVQFFT